MVKIYQETPNNISDILAYVISDVGKIVEILGANKKFYFYDTCSVIYHSNSDNRHEIVSYLKSKDAVIIISATVLMELSSNTFNVHQKQINYIKEMFDKGIKIVLLKEECVFDILRAYTTLTIQDSNKLLSLAICQMIKSKSKTYDIIASMSKEDQLKFKGVTESNTEIYTEFFSLARSKKESQDSLGEELMFLVIMLLGKLPGKIFIYLSDDKKSTAQLINVKEYVMKHYQNKAIMQLSTAAIIFKLYKQDNLSDKAVLLEIINRTSSDKRVSIRYIGEYDLADKQEKINTEDLIDMIFAIPDVTIIL